MPTTPKLSQLVEEIARLTPTQRRQLFLRLRAAGLFVPGDLQSDRNRLQALPLPSSWDTMGDQSQANNCIAPEPTPPPPPTTAKAATPTHTVPTHTVPTQAAPTASAPPQPLSRRSPAQCHSRISFACGWQGGGCPRETHPRMLPM